MCVVNSHCCDGTEIKPWATFEGMTDGEPVFKIHGDHVFRHMPLDEDDLREQNIAVPSWK